MTETLPFAVARTPQGVERRRDTVGKLVPAVKALVQTMHDALFAGSLDVMEHAHLQHLQRWLGELIAEQEAPAKPARTEAAPAAKTTRPKTRKK